MNETDIQGHIEELVAEEHRLYDKASNESLDAAEKSRLGDVTVQLDQYYDLLRQRRARREFAQDPADTQLRTPETVERYLQ